MTLCNMFSCRLSAWCCQPAFGFCCKHLDVTDGISGSWFCWFDI